MVYISLGIVLVLCGSIFLFVGVKKRWREMINGSLVLLLVGVFMFVAATLAFVTRG